MAVPARYPGADESQRVIKALRMLAGANDALLHASDERALLQAICDVAVREGGFRMAWVGQAVDDGRLEPLAQAGAGQAYLGTLDLIWTGDAVLSRRPVGQAMRTGQPALAPNILHDPRYASWKQDALRYGFASAGALPIVVKGERWGVFAVYAPEPDFHPEVLRDLEQLVRNLCFGIETMRARETQLHAEEELQIITDAVPALIFCKDTRGQLLRVNRAYAEAMGLSKEELVERPTTELYPETDLARYGEDDREVMATGQPKTGIIEPLRTTAGVRWLRTDKIPYRDSSGHIIGVIGFSVDITERKEAEDALLAAQERFTRFMNSGPLLGFIKDGAGRYIYVNTPWLHTFQRTPGEVLSHTDEEIWPPDTARQHRETDRRVLEEDGTAETTESVRFPDGSIHIMAVHKFPIPVPGAQQLIGGLALDITERVQVESALKEERAFFASAIELLPFPIYFLNVTDAAQVRANHATRRMLAAHRAERWDQVRCMTPDLRTEVPKSHLPALRALHGEVVPSTEQVLAFPDGSELPVLAQAAPVIVEEAQVAAVIALQDITAQKELDRAKNQFLNVLSHELKTPLTSIIGWGQLAEKVPEIQQQALEIILRNARQQQQLLEDLLDISRIIHGKLLLRQTEVDLWELVTEEVDRIRGGAMHRQLAVTLVAPEEALPVLADPRRIRQVFHHLLDNAMKFTEPGGAIIIEGSRRGDHAVIAVRDTGRGIEPSLLPTLFAPFRQIERTEATGGLGLGLMLVKGVVTLHGGQVTAQSEGIGKGSTFTVLLPMTGTD